MQAIRPLWVLPLMLGIVFEAKGAAGETPSQTPTLSPSEGPAESSGFQGSFAYGLGMLALSLTGERSLSKVPDSSVYGDRNPLSGDFTDASSRQLRTMASVVFGGTNRSFSLGLGLESLEIGSEQAPLKNSEGTKGSLRMNSLILAGSVQRSLGRWAMVTLGMSYDHGMEGELRSRYRVAAGQGDAPAYATLTDRLQSSSRLSIQVAYQLNIFPAATLGPYFQATFGTLRFRQRSEVSYIYGSLLGLSLQLAL